MQTATLKYKAATTSAGYRQLEQAMLHMGLLYNAAIRHREAATGWHRRGFSLKLQTAHLTELRAKDPVYAAYSRRLEDTVLKRVNTAYAEFFKRPQRVRPRTSSPHRFNTLEVCEPRVNHLTLPEDRKKGYIHVKGLPRLSFRPDQRIPEGV